MADINGGRVVWQLDAEDGNFTRSLDNASQQAASLGRTLGNIASGIGRTVFQGLQAGATVAGTAIIGLSTLGLQAGSDLQKTALSMNGLTHSTELGNKAFAQAYQFALKSPFAFPEVAQTTKSLLAMGMSVDDAISSLDIVGNVAVVSGTSLSSLGSIFGQVSAQGRLMLGDIRQLTENGVAILPALQKEFGKTADEVTAMATDGSISFDQFKIAMQSIVDPTILDQLTNTFPRQLDRLQASVRTLALAFVGVDIQNGFKATADGLQSTATQLMKNLATALRAPDVLAAFKGLGDQLAIPLQALTQHIPQIVGFIESLVTAFSHLGALALPTLGAFLGLFGGLASEIPFVGGVFSALSGPIGLIIGLFGAMVAVSPVLQGSLQLVFSTLASAAGSVLSAFAPLFPVIASLLGNVISVLVTALAPLISAVVQVVQVFAGSFATVLKALQPVIPQIGLALGAIAGAFAQIIIALLPLIPPLTQLAVTIIQQLLIPLMPILVTIIQLFARALILVVNAVVPLLPQFIQLSQVLISALAPILPQLADSFVQILVALLPILPPLLQLITLILPPLIRFIASGIVQFLSFAATLGGIIIPIVTAVIVILARIVTAFLEVSVAVANWVNNNINSIRSWYVAITGSIVNAIAIVVTLPGKIQSAIGNLSGLLINAGRQAIQGLIDGISGMFGSVKAKLGDLTSKLKDWKGPANVDKKLLVGSGRIIIQGFITGLESQYDAVKSSLGGLTNSLSANVDATGVTLSSDFTGSVATSGSSPQGAQITQNIYPQNELDMSVVNRNLAWEIR